MQDSKLLIIDSTREVGEPESYNSALQEVIASKNALSLPLSVVQEAWVAIDLTECRAIYVPGEQYVTSRTIIRRELAKISVCLQQKEQTWEGMQVVVVVDDGAEGTSSVCGGLMCEVRDMTGISPIVVGVDQSTEIPWYVVDCIPQRWELEAENPVVRLSVLQQ